MFVVINSRVNCLSLYIDYLGFLADIQLYIHFLLQERTSINIHEIKFGNGNSPYFMGKSSANGKRSIAIFHFDDRNMFFHSSQKQTCTFSTNDTLPQINIDPETIHIFVEIHLPTPVWQDLSWGMANPR